VGAYIAARPVLDVIRYRNELAYHDVIGASVILLALASVTAAYLVVGTTGVIRALITLRRQRTREHALLTIQEVFGRRWASYWANADEAINGLRIAADLSVPVVPLRGSAPGLTTNNFADFLLWPFRTVFNSLFAPAVDEFVSAALENKAFGGSYIGEYRYGASAWPPLGQNLSHVVSPDIAHELEERANAALSSSVIAFRGSLEYVAQDDPSIESFSARVKKNFTFSELIHTSYFICPGFIQLLANRILGTTSSFSQEPSMAGASPRASEPKADDDEVTLGRPRRARFRLAFLLLLRRVALIVSTIPVIVALHRFAVLPYTFRSNLQAVSREVPFPALLNYGPSRVVTIFSGDPRPVNSTDLRKESVEWPYRRPSDSHDFLETWFFRLEQGAFNDASDATVRQLLDRDGKPDIGARRSAITGMLLAAAMKGDAARCQALLNQYLVTAKVLAVNESDNDPKQSGDDFLITSDLDSKVESLLGRLITPNDSSAGLFFETVATKFLRSHFPNADEKKYLPALFYALLERGHLDAASKVDLILSAGQRHSDRHSNAALLWSASIRAGRYESALAQVESIDLSTSNTWAPEFEPLIEWLRKQKRNEEANAVVQKAFDATSIGAARLGIAGPGFRELAHTYARLGLPVFVARAMDRVPVGELPLLDLRRLGLEMVESGAWDSGIVVTRLDSYKELDRDSILNDLAEALASKGRETDASSLVPLMLESDARTITLGRIMAHSADLGRPIRALGLLPIFQELAWQQEEEVIQRNSAIKQKFEDGTLSQETVGLQNAADAIHGLALHVVQTTDAAGILGAAEQQPPQIGMMLLLESADDMLKRERVDEALTLLNEVVKKASSDDKYLAAVKQLANTTVYSLNGNYVFPGITLTWTVEGPDDVDMIEQVNKVLSSGLRDGAQWPGRLRNTAALLRVVRLARGGLLDEARANLPSVQSVSPEQLRAEAIVASLDFRAGRLVSASELVRMRPAVERDIEPGSPVWSVELFDAGLQEQALHLIGTQIATANKVAGDDSIRILEDLSFRWLKDDAGVHRAEVVRALFAAVRPSHLRDSRFARLSNLLLAKGSDAMASRFEEFIGDRGLRAASMLLYSRAITRPQVRRSLQLESVGARGATGGDPLQALGPGDQWARASSPEAANGLDKTIDDLGTARVLGVVAAQARLVSDLQLRSALLFEIADDFVRLGWLRSAIELSQDCLPGDRLRVTLSVLAFANSDSGRKR
jgi:hypothetical protein